MGFFFPLFYSCCWILVVFLFPFVSNNILEYTLTHKSTHFLHVACVSMWQRLLPHLPVDGANQRVCRQLFLPVGGVSGPRVIEAGALFSRLCLKSTTLVCTLACSTLYKVHSGSFRPASNKELCTHWKRPRQQHVTAGRRLLCSPDININVLP